MAEQKTTDFSQSYTDFTIKRPRWDSEGLPLYQAETEYLIKKILEDFNKPEFLPEVSEKVSRALVFSADQNFKTS